MNNYQTLIQCGQAMMSQELTWGNSGNISLKIDSGSFLISAGGRNLGALSEDDLIRQRLITSLMCNFVVNFKNLQERFGINYHEYFKEEHKQLNGFIDDGFLKVHEDRLELTEIGRTFVRNIAMTYDAYLNKKDNVKKATFSRTI